jgi:hypothetical protein
MSQNLLSNVFKPTYVYDTVSQTYSSRLELLNIDTVSANVVAAFTVAIGDAFGNVYVGINSGNSYLTPLGNSNVTALGVNAGQGSSNSSRTIFIGYGAGVGALNSINTIAIGANTIASGTGNIYIGTGTGSPSGTSNIFIGQQVNPGGSPSNLLLIGQGSNYAISADMSTTPPNVGIGTATPAFPLDVNGYVRIGGISAIPNGGLGINANPYDYTLNVNGDMQVTDGYGILRFTHDASCNSVTTLDVTGTYSSSNAVATLGVTGGFFSYRGILPETGTATVIGVASPGLFLVSVQTAGGDYDTFYGMFSTAIHQITRSSNVTMISFAGTAIKIDNGGSSGSMSWVITYFPSLPF